MTVTSTDTGVTSRNAGLTRTFLQVGGF